MPLKEKIEIIFPPNSKPEYNTNSPQRMLWKEPETQLPLQTTSYKLQTTNYKLQTTNYKLQTTNYKTNTGEYYC